MYIYTKSFILFIGFKNLNIFSHINMAAKYAEIGRLGKVELGF